MDQPETSAAPDNRDHVLPEGKWQFDAEVTDVFEEMLRRSIPQYDVMRRAVFEIATRFAKEKTAIVDLGCSRGDALDPLISKYGAYNRFVGVEVSKPMLEAARKRFQGYIDCGVVYGNEDFVGRSLEQIMKSGVQREEFWINSKVWNNHHQAAEVN